MPPDDEYSPKRPLPLPGPPLPDSRKTINERRLERDPFYDTPSFGLSRPGGVEGDAATGDQVVIAKTRRILTYTIYQRSLDLPPVAAGKALLQLLPRLVGSSVLRPTAVGLLNITLCLKSAAQAEFAIAECKTRGVITGVLNTFSAGVVSQAEGGWQPPQGPSVIIAGYGVAPYFPGWSVEPTFPILTNGGSADESQLEQGIAPGTIGSSIQWVYGNDDPLIVKNLVNDGAATPNGIVVWNQSTSASPAVRATVRWMEFSSSDAPSSFT